MDLKGFSPKSSFRVPGRFGGLRVLTRYLPLPLVATMLALPAAATIDRWGYTSYLWRPDGEGPHDYNDAANYEGEHKPVSFEGVYYTSGGTVRIPAATARWWQGAVHAFAHGRAGGLHGQVERRQQRRAPLSRVLRGFGGPYGLDAQQSSRVGYHRPLSLRRRAQARGQIRRQM